MDGADPVAPVALSLAIILVIAKLGGDLAVRVKQPPVVGELVFGMLLGNLGVFDWLKSDPSIDMLSRLGVVILLFEVGLDSTVGEMIAVAPSSLLVALAGVVAPFALGWLVAWWLLPGEGALVHAFVGATLCATSVGITARVLHDLGRAATAEARVILGAAVVDDVLGLILLAVVTGAIQASERGGAISPGEIVLVLVKSAAFLVGALLLGWKGSRLLFRAAALLKSRDVLLAVGLGVCFALAWLSSRIGLSPIIGAFAAGLLLESSHYVDFVERGEPSLEVHVHPIASFLVPIFFVLMGLRTDVRALAHPRVLALAAALTVAACAGKLACSLGVVQKGVDRLAVGVGMIPRGEVGLIFANVGAWLALGGRHVIEPPTFSAVVAMVVMTTLITPPALKWSLLRAERRARL